MVDLAQFTREAVQQALNAIERTLGVNPIPGLRDTDRLELLRYLRPIHREAAKVGFAAGSYTHGATASDQGYVGGVYSPTQNRIYMVPYGQANPANANWHYIDCETGAIVAYAHGVTTVTDGYAGGVYSPTQNRIYLVPYGMGAPAQTQWHYIDCDTGAVVAYTHGVTTVDLAYAGGVYSPIENRIYFVPIQQAAQSSWHYIDCDTEDVVAYAHGLTHSMASFAYFGGVYSPTQNRIYFVPMNQSAESEWDYIDCDTGTAVGYTNGATAVAFGYAGGAYSPTQNRIYFAPRSQGPEPEWHYIDCDTGAIVAYTHVATAISAAYASAVYCPTTNRIYLVPLDQADQTNWHYIDCDDGSVVAYANGVTAGPFAYWGGVWNKGRIWFTPYEQANDAVWHYIQEYSDIPVSRNLMAGALFNKY